MGLLLSCDILKSCETGYSGEDQNFFEKELLSFQGENLVRGAWAATCISHRLGVNVYLHSRDTTCWNYSWASLAVNARVSSLDPWVLEVLFFDCMCFILCCPRHMNLFWIPLNSMTAALLVSSTSLCYSEKLNPGHLRNSLGPDWQRNRENPQGSQVTQLSPGEQ